MLYEMLVRNAESKTGKIPVRPFGAGDDGGRLLSFPASRASSVCRAGEGEGISCEMPVRCFAAGHDGIRAHGSGSVRIA